MNIRMQPSSLEFLLEFHKFEMKILENIWKYFYAIITKLRKISLFYKGRVNFKQQYEFGIPMEN